MADIDYEALARKRTEPAQVDYEELARRHGEVARRLAEEPIPDKPFSVAEWTGRQVRGMRAPFYGAAHGTKRWMDEFQKAADVVGQYTGMEPQMAFEWLSKTFGPPSDYQPEGFWEEVSFGLTDGFADLIPLMAMKTHPSISLGAVGGFHGGMQEGMPGFLKGTGMGAAMGPIFKFGKYARRAFYAPGVGSLFAAQSLAEDPTDVRGAARNFAIGFIYTLGQGKTAKEARQLKDLAQFEDFMLKLRQKGLSYKDVVFPDLKKGMRVFAKGEAGIVSHIDKSGDVWVKVDSKPNQTSRFAYHDVMPQAVEVQNPTVGEIYKSIAEDYKARHPNLSKNAILRIDAALKVQGSGGSKVNTGRTVLELNIIRDMKDPELRTFWPYVRKQLLTSNRQIAEMGPDAVNLFYWPMKIAEHRAMLHLDILNRRVTDIFKGLPLGASERIAEFAYARQVNGRRLLLKAGRSKKYIRDLLNSFATKRPAEHNAYLALREILESQYTQINDARAMAGLKPMPKVKNYFTFAQAANYMQTFGLGYVGIEPGQVQKAMDQFVRPRATHAPFLEPRTQARYKPLIDAKELIRRYLRYSTRHIHMTPTISHLRDLLQPWQVGWQMKKDGNFKVDADGKRIPKIYDPQKRMPGNYAMLQDWLNYAAGMPEGTDKIWGPEVTNKLKRMNSHFGYALLSFNVRSAFIQPSAIRNSVVEIGPVNTLKGIMSLLDPGLKNRAMGKSRVLMGRAQELFTKEVYAGMKQGQYFYPFAEWIGRKGMKPLQTLDFYTALATWEGAYRKAKGMKVGEEQAIRFADDVVNRTQASSSPLDISPAQRTAFGRSLTMFQTFVINDANFFFHDILGKRVPKSKAQRASQMAKYFVTTALVNMFYEDAMGMTSPFGAPIRKFKERLEEGLSWRWALLSAMGECAELMPFPASSFRYGTSVAGPTVDQATDFINWYQAKSGGRKVPARDVLQVVGTFIGVPGIRQAAKMKRAYSRGGNVADIGLGRYIEPIRRPPFPPRFPGLSITQD